MISYNRVVLQSVDYCNDYHSRRLDGQGLLEQGNLNFISKPPVVSESLGSSISIGYVKSELNEVTRY